MGFSLTGPVWFSLAASPWVHKHAEHYNKLDIFVVDSLPEIVKGSNWGLAEDGEDLAIYKGADFIGVDIIIGVKLGQLNSAVLI